MIVQLTLALLDPIQDQFALGIREGASQESFDNVHLEPCEKIENLLVLPDIKSKDVRGFDVLLQFAYKAMAAHMSSPGAIKQRWAAGWSRQSLNDLPEGILARDFAFYEFKQVHAPHLEILPRD